MWIRKFWCRMKMIQEEVNKVAIDQPEKKKKFFSTQLWDLDTKTLKCAVN